MHTNNHKYYFDENGKTKKSTRDIPLFPQLAEAIKGKHGKLVSNADGSEITLSGWASLYASYVNKMETAINGIQRRWYGKSEEHKKILAEGGTLPPFIEFTVKPYDLRHSFCTMCRDNEIELNTVVQWMGHADATMVLKIYDEVSTKRDEKQAEKLRKILLKGQYKGQKSDDPAK